MTDINWKTQVSSQQQGKENNISLVFTLIRYYGAISRAEIAHKTGLSPTTISYLADQLLTSGFVFETGNGERSTVGRKPIMLQVNPQGGVIASLEFLADGFSCALYDLTIQEISEQHVLLADYHQIGQTAADTISRMLQAHQLDSRRLLGISIGIPAVIDYTTRQVLRSTVLPVSGNLSFMEPLQQCFPRSFISLGNQSGFCAYAEKTSGAYESLDHLIYLDINIGVGAGLIIDNHIFSGSGGMAAEIGHTTVDVHGRRCKCGNLGCLETMVSIPAIKGRILSALVLGRDSLIKDLVQGDVQNIDLGVLAAAYHQRDKLAVEIVHETADYLAAGINNVINLFDPQIVVIGGPLQLLGDSFLNRIRLRLKIVSLKPGREADVHYAVLHEQVVHLGGVRYVLDHVIDFAHCMEQLPGV